ncbi:MAG: hypothetical protein EXS01_06840 [Phycisphaerales bacterium]|nr:hypothetical protein [Phycisphaerales bacterium]
MTPAKAKPLRLIGFILGVALLAAAIMAIARSAPTLEHLREVVVRPDAFLIVCVVAAALGSLIGSSGMFFALLRPFGRITLFEMVKLIAASSVLNYLPLRPGLFGRLAYQQIVSGIPMRRSVLSVVEAAVICAVSIFWMAAVVAIVRWTDARAVGGVLVALPILCGLALALPDRSRLRPYLEAIFWRWIDLIAWTVRYAVVFAMLGVELTPESAAAAACIAGAANMIPFLGNGLGVREWAIGLAGPALATWTTDIGLAAELINRAVELVVIVPIGWSSMPWIARAVRGATPK